MSHNKWTISMRSAKLKVVKINYKIITFTKLQINLKILIKKINDIYA